jgi:hypothetical protein
MRTTIQRHDAHVQIEPMQARRREMSTDLEQMLRRVLVAFNEHNLDAIMSHFAGCDLWAFDAEGKVVRKDCFWKIRETR